MIGINFEGKRPTNKEILNVLTNGYEVAVKLIENKGEGEKPNELTICMLNLITSCLKATAEEHNIEYIFSAIATYINLFKFKSENKGRQIFEKTMAKISEILSDETRICVSPIELLAILNDNAKKVVV